jgi:two-component system, OmpR family, sensor histidine kinase ChvG
MKDIPSSRPRRRAISPITGRILAVNLIALGVLVAGLLYLGDYRRNLIETELTAMQQQAEMFAAALGEGAVVTNTAGSFLRFQALVPNSARPMIRRLVEPTGTRARLFGSDGVLIVDSRLLFGPGGLVQIEDLPPPETGEGPIGWLLSLYDDIVNLIPGVDDMPDYVESPVQKADDYAEVVYALRGETAGAVRAGQNTMILSVSAPVQRYKQVLGALMLSRDSRHIDATLYELRLDILKVFGVSLTITVLLSIYLARTIAQPIHRLADAAEQVRHARNRQATIPTFPGRQDEIGELAQVLSEMTEALWLRMDAIEGFAADVAHEIKNPLTSLHSAVETIARVTDPEQQRKLMGIIQEDVQRLDRLISDISEASRLDAELSRAEMEPIEINGMISAMKDLHGASGTADTPEISLDLPAGETFRVNGTEGRLYQVFRNLVSNALSFSPAGGKIEITVRREDGQVKIEISDDGPGIPAGKEADIFDRFYTERPDKEAFGTHSGLGLSISKQIVEAHGGRIWAENRIGNDGSFEGARFIVCLPTT